MKQAWTGQACFSESWLSWANLTHENARDTYCGLYQTWKIWPGWLGTLTKARYEAKRGWNFSSFFTLKNFFFHSHVLMFWFWCVAKLTWTDMPVTWWNLHRLFDFLNKNAGSSEFAIIYRWILIAKSPKWIAPKFSHSCWTLQLDFKPKINSRYWRRRFWSQGQAACEIDFCRPCWCVNCLRISS